jgi:phosphopantothenoylcysteine decarboxylase/phosphopantothenate--cysteine ligase
MGGDHNVVVLVSRDGVEEWPRLSKDDVARRLIAKAAKLLRAAPKGTA